MYLDYVTETKDHVHKYMMLMNSEHFNSIVSTVFLRQGLRNSHIFGKI